MSNITDMHLVRDAKQFLEDHILEGVDCPVCGRFAREYERPIHRTMARMLIRLYHLTARSENVYFYSGNIAKGISTTGTNDFSKFRFLGLVEEMPKGIDQDQRTSGMWRITPSGKLFVENQMKVHKYAVIRMKEFRGLTGDMISIEDALGKSFSYKELMRG